MDKGRLEAFSDSVFSIVITLFIFNIHVPELPPPVTDAALWSALGAMFPVFAIFITTFAVLSVFWINHHFLFHSMVKTVDRRLNLLNLVYLMFVTFLPFSASLLGTYHATRQPAAIIYGLNVLAIVLLSSIMLSYVRHRPAIMMDDVSSRTLTQARVRGGVSLCLYALGLVCTFFSAPLSVFFYTVPVVFNIIPGTLNLVERIFGFTLV